ncbi:hypothetical protein NL676_038154 [Syzygium grande]|nr:hypothetical protein NL676_038154 [Syzygium grande]
MLGLASLAWAGPSLSTTSEARLDLATLTLFGHCLLSVRPPWENVDQKRRSVQSGTESRRRRRGDEWGRATVGKLAKQKKPESHISDLRFSSGTEEMAEPISKSVISALVALVLVLVSVSSALAGPDAVPFVVAYKKAALGRLRHGADRVSVTVDVYNRGASSAYDVSLVDNSWPLDVFAVVSGNTSRTWERIDGGGLVSHSFELEAKEKGMFAGAPAVITFRIPTKAALQEAYSTPILPLDILADRPPQQKIDWVKRLLAQYGSLISVISFVVLFVYLISSPSRSSAAKEPQAIITDRLCVAVAIKKTPRKGKAGARKMSYQRAPHDPYPPPPGYPSAPQPPPGYPSAPPGYPSAPPFEAYPYPQPTVPVPPPPPRPPFEGYQGYFAGGYPPPPPPPPSLPHYHHHHYDHHHYNDQPGCGSFLQGCLAALCCCCMMEECCFFLR